MTLGELFQIDYTIINEERPATAQAEAPYTPETTVPVSLTSALTFLSKTKDKGQAFAYRALATAGDSPDYATLAAQTWQALPADARFDVLLAAEEATMSDGDYLITVQIRLCFADGDLEFCYASGYENLEVVLDRQAPYLVSMTLAVPTRTIPFFLTVLITDVVCDNVSQALAQQIFPERKSMMTPVD